MDTAVEKVYVVTSGEYSDYAIQRVFSTRELAEEFCDRFDDDTRIEEYVLDDQMPPREENVFEINLNLKTGEATCVSLRGGELKDLIRMILLHEESYMKLYIKTDSKKRAIKIASERYAEVIANEQIKFPYLRAGVVMEYGSAKTPYYDFKTGEIAVYGEPKYAFGLPPFVRVRQIKK